MEFKGTKGEWIVDFGSTLGHIKAVSDNSIKTPTVAKYRIFSDIRPEKVEEEKYNAILISKAPEMLRAMQEFCERVEIGEVRSSKTYEKFKSIIKEATTL